VNSVDILSGLPNKETYEHVLKSALYEEMERFSDTFLLQHQHLLKTYRHKWVADPLHQWSRQYEYPFVYSKIMSFTKDNPEIPISILDAGSGVTFFPYYLASIFRNSRVDCTDFNTLPAILIPKINSMTDTPVGFYRSDIRALPFDNNTYDVIYCISVLEHTKAFSQIIQEFKRLLRPGGILLVTFDISIDGDLDIPLKLAIELLHELGRSFNYPKEIGDLSSESLVTTRFIRSIDPSLLPWKYPSIQFLKSFTKFRFPKTFFPNLTFYCVSIQKKA